MATINIDIKNNITSYSIANGDFVVCGNSDHKAVFTFDSGWTDADKNNARAVFWYDGKEENKKIQLNSGSYECVVPFIENSNELKIGVRLEHTNIMATTMAVIPLYPSIRSKEGYLDDAAIAQYLEEVQAARNDIDHDVADIAKNIVNARDGYSKLEKEVENLEHHFDDELFITDDNIAHAKFLPDNVLPWAEITKIGGMCSNVSSDNLLNLPSVINKAESGLVNYDLFTGTYGGAEPVKPEHINNLPFLDVGDYYFSYKIDDNKTADISIREVDDDGIIGATLAGHSGTTFKVQKRTRVTLRVYPSEAITIKEIMLNTGTKAIPYKKYVKPGLAYAPIDRIDSIGKNLLNPMKLGTPAPNNGITATKNSNGSYTVKGTAGVGGASLYLGTFSKNDIPIGEYYYSCPFEGTGRVITFYEKYDGGTYKGNWDWKSEQNIEIDYRGYTSIMIFFYIVEGITVDLTAYPMLNHGTEKLPWEPHNYSAILIPSEIRN